MADELNTASSEKDFTKMSKAELIALAVAEGDKFIEQTADGDIAGLDYIASENFTPTRLYNVLFAFEYLNRTEDGMREKEKMEYKEGYTELYNVVLQTIQDSTELSLFGAEYLLKL